MTRLMTLLSLCLLTFFAIGVHGVRSEPVQADEDELEFDTVNVFIEFNDTDQDVGLQVLLDGEPYKKVKMFNPNEKVILDIKAKRAMGQQGLSELFFESSEPSLADVPLSTFLSRFPAGIYEFEGVTIDGEEIEGEGVLTHVIPSGPVVLSPVSMDDDPPVVNAASTVISWAPVTTTIFGTTNLVINNYQVIVSRDDPKRSLLIDLPASVTSIAIPSEFLEPDTEYEFEILAREESGNQTITAGEFETLP